jgi:hypothetical protein
MKIQMMKIKRRIFFAVIVGNLFETLRNLDVISAKRR